MRRSLHEHTRRNSELAADAFAAGLERQLHLGKTLESRADPMGVALLGGRGLGPCEVLYHAYLTHVRDFSSLRSQGRGAVHHPGLAVPQ